MIRWTGGRDEVRVRDFAQLARGIGAAPTVRLLAQVASAPLMLVGASAARQIVAHLHSSRHEIGGLLLGQAYALPVMPRHGFGYLVSVEEHVPSAHFDSSPVSLRMEPELWQRATPLIDAGMSVVGWYHSHPGLGAFFSGTDRATQRAFFPHPYSTGLVVDPLRGEHACYAGPDSTEPGFEILVSPSLEPFGALLGAH